MLVKFKDNYASKQSRNYRDSNEAWINAKMEFSRAKKVALIKKEKILKFNEFGKGSAAKQALTHEDALDFLKLLPEMCFVSTANPEKAQATMQQEEDLKRKAQNAFEVAKKKLMLAACDVVIKEIQCAQEFEILSTMNLSVNHLKFEKEGRHITGHESALAEALESLKSEIKSANDHVAIHRKEAEKLEKKLTPADLEDTASPAQVRARKKRMEVEVARLSPQVAEGKVLVAKCTAQLFEAVQAFNKAVEVHGALMVAKAEARVRSRLAMERAERVRAVQRADEGEHEGRLFALALDEEDTEELDAVKEPSIPDMKRQRNRLVQVVGKVDEKRVEELDRAMEALEKRQSLESYQATDLNAETQIARLRVGYEAAEASLWEEWVRMATAEETDKPSQDPGTPIPARAARADAAYKEVRAAVIEAKKEVSQQSREELKSPAYLKETPARNALASGRWEPGKGVADFAVCLARLERPAERALRMAGRALDGPMGALKAPTPEDLRGELGDLKRALAALEEAATAAARSRPAKPPAKPSGAALDLEPG